jgi:type IV pilus assembly protein PilQ
MNKGINGINFNIKIGRLRAFVLFLCCFSTLQAQENRFVQIENKLKALETEMPGLDEKIELSVSDISIQEFVRAIASTSKVNIYIDPALNIRVTNNFSNVTTSAILLFLSKQYDLDITFFGNILSISKYVPPVVEIPKAVPPPPKPIHIKYDPSTLAITMDLSNDSLFKVTKEITRQTGKNIIFPPEISAMPVSIYVENVSIDNAIDKMAMSNGLLSTVTKDGFYILEKPAAPTQQSSGSTRNASRQSGRTNASGRYEYNISNGLITLSAQDVAITDIVNDISRELKLDYAVYSNIQGNITTQLYNVTYDQVLERLLNGTQYTVSKAGGIYMIGERQSEGLRQTKVVQLQHRSVDKIVEHIPKELQKDVSIKEFPELNSLILSGSKLMIDEIELFIRSVDKVVPVVLIEVIIISSKKYYNVNTGLNAGLGEAPAQTSFLFSNAGIQTTLSSKTLNDILSGIEGFGSWNLGRVTPNFYVSLNLLEQQGVVKIHSTPRLATLNSHEATLVMGETEFYKESQNTVVGTLSPQTIESYQYKSISANLSVSIKPMFSGDDQVTLDIKVEQSGFKKNRVPNAPPGSDNKSFTSLIRVKNEEMVLLGGLEEKSNSNTGNGIPLLSRIPILKWIFSSREKEKIDSQLNIFIKPTVLF